MSLRRVCSSLVVMFAVAVPVTVGAGVVDFELVSQGLVADGAAFGNVGPYEKLTGRAILEVHPDSPHNLKVTDIKLAPRTEEGMVRYAADVYVLRPAESERGNGSALIEICNRGGKAVIRYFNRSGSRTLDPTAPDDFGDGFLMRRGFTLVWIGWQFDVPDREGLLRLHAPVAENPTGAIEGLVRANEVFSEPTQIFRLGHRDHQAYPVSSPNDPRNQLTVRDSRLGDYTVLPRRSWRFAHLSEDGSVVPDPTSIYLESGFQPGKIYEAVYVSENPTVVGLGLTAVRDIALALKSHPKSPARVDRVLAVGISQTGRFLRHLLYQGFNSGEEGQIAVDGVWAHTAGAGRGSFNHRFGQPSRDAHRFSAFLYPTDIFPFSATTQKDPETGRKDGIFKRLDGSSAQPKVFWSNTGYEYWGRAAALVHTSIDGKTDLQIPESLRIYHFASTQHFVGRNPPRKNGTRFPNNPTDFFWILRSLLVELDEWVKDSDLPPDNRIPKLSNGTLVRRSDLAFPTILGVEAPAHPHEAYRVDYGQRFLNQGIVDIQPPQVGAVYPVLVPQVDSDGNELGGVRLPEIIVPVATYTPWNYRSKEIGSPHEMADFRGSFFPFTRTKSDRLEASDPRLSLQERYPTKEHYLGLYTLAAVSLVDEGFLLPEDITGLIRRGEGIWNMVTNTPR